MATVEECETAMHELAGRLGSMEDGTRRKVALDRSVSCHLRDLGVTFRGQLKDGELRDIAQVGAPDAQIKLAMSSDDLLALVGGSLNFGRAWASGRLKVDASVFDLIKLRSLM